LVEVLGDDGFFPAFEVGAGRVGGLAFGLETEARFEGADDVVARAVDRPAEEEVAEVFVFEAVFADDRTAGVEGGLALKTSDLAFGLETPIRLSRA
jgi:hypothetical protein